MKTITRQNTHTLTATKTVMWLWNGERTDAGRFLKKLRKTNFCRDWR